MAHVTLAGAQVRPLPRDTAVAATGAMPMASGAAQTMSGPHHALAMAYGEALATFARALNDDVSQSHTVNVDLARPATIEMRRSFDQMTVHHQAQMANMSTAMRMPMSADSAAGMSRSARRDSMTATMPASGRRDSARVKPMTPPMRSDSTMVRPMTTAMSADSSRTAGTGTMQAQMAGLEKHLGMLETEVNSQTPDAARVIEHTAEILKICAAAKEMSPNPMMAKPRAPGAP